MRELRIFLSSFLAFSYLILSIGIDLEAHYCHDDLASYSVSFADNNCECGDNFAEMSCCSSEEKLIQFDQPCFVQQKLSTDALQALVENEVKIQNTTYQRVQIKDNQFDLETIGPKIFLLNSSFIHYG